MGFLWVPLARFAPEGMTVPSGVFFWLLGFWFFGFPGALGPQATKKGPGRGERSSQGCIPRFSGARPPRDAAPPPPGGGNRALFPHESQGVNWGTPRVLGVDFSQSPGLLSGGPSASFSNCGYRAALAAFAHQRLVNIHPFVDGNGRVSRLLMNLVLLKNNYQLISITRNERTYYIDAIRDTHNRESATSNPVAFYNFIADCELKSQKEYMRLLHLHEDFSDSPSGPKPPRPRP
jgi:hypothetical protein